MNRNFSKKKNKISRNKCIIKIIKQKNKKHKIRKKMFDLQWTEEAIKTYKNLEKQSNKISTKKTNKKRRMVS